MGNNAAKTNGSKSDFGCDHHSHHFVGNIYTTGFIKSISILIGLIAGTAIAASMGLVDFTPVSQAPVVHVPTPFFFGAPKFEITSILMMCIHRDSFYGGINRCLSCTFRYYQRSD